MNIALNQNDWKQANEIFNSALVANVGFILIQLPILALGVWKLDFIIDFPPEVATDFRLLVAFNITLFFLNIVRGAFFTPITAANQLYINSRFEIAAQLSRLVFITLLILHYGPRLWIIGAVELGVAIAIFMSGLLVYRKLVNKNLTVSGRYVNWKWFAPILKMAFWMIAFALGQSLFVRTDVWVLNKFDSVAGIAGVYAALLYVPNFLRQIGNQVATLMTPVYMIDFAKNNIERIATNCIFLSKAIAMFGALLGGVLCGGAPILIHYWLGDDYIQYTGLLAILMLYVVLTLNKAVTWPVFTAFNEVDQLGVTTLLCGALNIALSIWFVLLGWGAYGVALGTLLSLFLLYGILYPWRVSRILKIRLRPFMVCHVQALVAFGLVAGGTYGLVCLPINLMLQLLGIGVVVLLVSVLTWFVLLHKSEREQIVVGLEKLRGMLPWRI